MFIAGRVYEKAEDARIWVEQNTTPDERRYWYIVQLFDEELKFKIENRPVLGLKMDGIIDAPPVEPPSEEPVSDRKLIEDLQKQVLGLNTQLLVAKEKLEKQAVQLRGDAVTEEKVARAFARLPPKEE